MGAALKGPWDADAEVAAAPWEHDQEVTPAGESPSTLGAVVRGSHAGAMLGLRPQLEGLASAVGGTLTGEEGSFGDRYRKKRDETLATEEEYQTAHPDAYRVGKIGGSLGAALIPGSPSSISLGKGLAGAMATGAALGGTEALAESKADLTRGEWRQAAEDTAVGAVGGAAGGALGHGVGKVGGWLADKAGAGIRGAEADAAALENAARQKALRIARSSLGGEAAAAENALKRAEEMVANASGHYRPDQIANAAGWLGGPEAAELRQRAADNLLEAGQNRIPGSLATAENVFRQAQADVAPQAVEAGAAERLANPIGRQILPRLKNYASRAIPPIVGAAVGGPVGAAAGFVAGAAMGNPGTSLANALKSPAVRKLAWGLVESGSSALGRFGPYLQRIAASAGAAVAQELHERLLDSDPDYQKKVAHGLQEAQQVEPTPEGP